MGDPIITVENLSKRYVIGRKRSRDDGLRHVIEAAVRAPFAWLRRGRAQRRGPKEEFWALRGLDLRVAPGEVVGILGRNGAGKSTLLKLLSRITEPTTGRIRLRGRVASLLEVGTGFHQELTGRENIYLNGAILGMTRAEIRRKFDEIVAFSEIEQFLDTPVKRYSSGMYVRLAFAVAAHLEAEIMLVDEVLAVGDASFQRKCLGKMGDVASGGRTILFVSHNMEAVRRLCRRGVWLEGGRIRADGEIESIAQAYFNSARTESPVRIANDEYGLAITGVTLRNGSGEATATFRPGEDLVVDIAYAASRPVDHPYLALVVQGIKGFCFTANMLLDGHRPAVLEGTGRIACRFRAIPLLPQDYSVLLAIRARDGRSMIVNYHEVAQFAVSCNLVDYGYRGEFLSLAPHSTPVVVPYEWQLPDGRRAPVALTLPAGAHPDAPPRP